MLNLQLRDEFLGSQMPGTAITLRRRDGTGATQQPPDQIFSITYPTADIQTALRALSKNRERRPIVLMGDRGRGKSHIMAVMHHAIQAPDFVENWARGWGTQLGSPTLQQLTAERGLVAISEPVHNHEYPLLWDLLFERHPSGQLFKGRFQALKQPYPPRSLLEEMFESHPTALILDEFQKWFDGLHDDPTPTGRKWREAASNFVQNLSEISKDRPDILIFVISVLNSNTEAFRQVHRNGPVIIDFRGPTAKQDRKRLLLHRLFKNRENIPAPDVRSLVDAYASERFRLRFSHLSGAERARIVSEVAEVWPFAPELLELLDDHILMADAAQETRDLIRILAQVFRSRGGQVPVITSADFFVDDDSCGVQSLLDSIATVGEQEKLREVAQRNLEAIRTSGAAIPRAREIVSALWMRSMSPTRTVGGTRPELHLDITRDRPIDDNAFQNELVLLIENSVNIHGEESADGRLHFQLGENPRSRVRATARNDKIWQPGASEQVVGQAVYPEHDLLHIRNTIRHILTPDTKQAVSRVIVLGPKWQTEPWAEVDELDRPEKWDRPVLIVLPESCGANSSGSISDLGRWLATHVPVKRNTVRFLIPTAASVPLFRDPDLILQARCSYLTAIAWKDDPRYRGLKEEFDKPYRDGLKSRFDRFAILHRWDFQQPDSCLFEVVQHGKSGGDIPSEIERRILAELFDPSEFQTLLVQYASRSEIVGDLLDELAEPPAKSTDDALPFLGDTAVYEQIIRVAAKGTVFLNVGGTWYGRLPEHSDEEEALRHLQRAFRSGQEMRRVQLGLPGAVGGTTVTGPRAVLQPTGGTVLAPPPTSDGTGQGTVTAPAGPTTIPAQAPDGGVVAAPVAKVEKTMEPQTGINLSGMLEKWGVAPATQLLSAKIEFADLTVQQLKQILQRLPSAFRASMEITYPEENK